MHASIWVVKIKTPEMTKKYQVNLKRNHTESSIWMFPKVNQISFLDIIICKNCIFLFCVFDS